MAVAIEDQQLRQRGLFLRGMRLVWAYIKLHPKPFFVSVAGALLFAVSSLLLTQALGRATDEVLRPAFEGGVSSAGDLDRRPRADDCSGACGRSAS